MGVVDGHDQWTPFGKGNGRDRGRTDDNPLKQVKVNSSGTLFHPPGIRRRWDKTGPPASSFF